MKRLAEIDFFLMHSVVLPESLEPKSHHSAEVSYRVYSQRKFDSWSVDESEYL